MFDDPVSSLDSDVLFIVSTLIKRVLKEASEGNGQIKQVFLLTHNIYFHKEVSFDPSRGTECRANETFWIIRKVEGASKIVGYKYNPIKTSYELLWAEVRAANRSNMAIQNTLRRIIEYYFKILGNVDTDDIVGKFEGKDQQLCASLFSWVNDGSHSAHDDLYVSVENSMVDRYLNVFRRIFEKTGHCGHYNMMMGDEGPIDLTPTWLASPGWSRPRPIIEFFSGVPGVESVMGAVLVSHFKARSPITYRVFRTFDEWIAAYNEARPHQGAGGRRRCKPCLTQVLCRERNCCRLREVGHEIFVGHLPRQSTQCQLKSLLLQSARHATRSAGISTSATQRIAVRPPLMLLLIKGQLPAPACVRGHQSQQRSEEKCFVSQMSGCSVVSTVISWSDRNREVSIPLRALGQQGQLHDPCLQPATLPSWLRPRRLPCVER
ncbi:hypothetical protein ABH973_003793 [Bradyrhizobium ottawaense]